MNLKKKSNRYYFNFPKTKPTIFLTHPTHQKDDIPLFKSALYKIKKSGSLHFKITLTLGLPWLDLVPWHAFFHSYPYEYDSHLRLG